jgi:alpha-N-arabinofuranosidase
MNLLNLGKARLLSGISGVAFLSTAAFGQEASTPQASPMEITIDTSHTREAISPYIYGQFIEHLGRCIYGGIWAEMLEDRKFYFPVPARGAIWRETRQQARVLSASPWKVIGPPESVTLGTNDVFAGASAPMVEAPGNGTKAGLYQEELGLLKGKAYVGYVYVAGDASAGPANISLSWGPGSADMQSATAKVSSKYVRVPFRFTAQADTDNGRLAITTSGKGRLRIGCFSLMPADNVDGFRKDTLELLKQLKGAGVPLAGREFRQRL